MQCQTKQREICGQVGPRQESSHALTVSTMAVTIGVIIIEGVGAPRGSATKFKMTSTDTAINDVGCDSRTVTNGLICAVEGQILLVDAIESPCS